MIPSIHKEILRVTEHPHCSYCVLDHETVRKIGQIILIFLDMDGVMIADRFSGATASHIDKTAFAMFGKKRITELQWRLAASPHLDQNAVGRLMRLIHAIEAVGKSVGIVISSAWRCDGTTMEVCYEMFACQPFSDYIIGRTASKESFDPEFQLIADKPAFLKNIKRKYGLDLKNRGCEIRHWLFDHSASRDYVIFDDYDDGIRSLFNKRFIKTYNLLEESHIERALLQLKIKNSPVAHCQECNMTPQDSAHLSDKVVFFLDVEELLDEGTLTDPLGGYLVKSLTRIHRGEKPQVYSISQRIPVNALAEWSLAYLIDKMKALGQKVGVVLISKWNHLTTEKATKRRFKNMFFYPYLLGMTRTGENGVEEWVKRHQIKKHAVLNIKEQLGRGTKTDVEAFIRNFGFITKKIPARESLHCNFCVLDQREISTVKKMILIYLDIVGVLIDSYKSVSGDKSHPWEVKPAHLLNAKAVDRLMFFIRTIEKNGKQVGIVIISDWRTSETTENVCSEMFASQPFNSYIIGRIPSTVETDPELIRMHSGRADLKRWDSIFYRIISTCTTTLAQIEYWAQAHAAEHHTSVIFQPDSAGFPSYFNSVRVKRSSLMGWKEISKASRMILGSFGHQEIPKITHCKFCIFESKEHNILREGIIIFIDKEKIVYGRSSINYDAVELIMEDIAAYNVKGIPVGLVLFNTSSFESTKKLCSTSFSGLPFASDLVGRVPSPLLGQFQKYGEVTKDHDPMQSWIDDHQPKDHQNFSDKWTL